MTIQNFLTDLSEHCGIDPDTIAVTVEEQDDAVVVQVEVPESDSGLFIGFHGETLDSLQRLTRIIFQESYPDKKIRLNINQYREQREEKLQIMARSGAQRVLDTGESYTFTVFIPSHERFIIHTTLSDDPAFADLESVSEGEGRDRRLTIKRKSN